MKWISPLNHSTEYKQQEDTTTKQKNRKKKMDIVRLQDLCYEDKQKLKTIVRRLNDAEQKLYETTGQVGTDCLIPPFEFHSIIYANAQTQSDSTKSQQVETATNTDTSNTHTNANDQVLQSKIRKKMKRYTRELGEYRSETRDELVEIKKRLAVAEEKIGYLAKNQVELEHGHDQLETKTQSEIAHLILRLNEFYDDFKHSEFTTVKVEPKIEENVERDESIQTSGYNRLIDQIKDLNGKSRKEQIIMNSNEEDDDNTDSGSRDYSVVEVKTETLDKTDEFWISHLNHQPHQE